jgi:hypothetical protein
MGNYATLPENDDDLENPYLAQDISDVASDDGSRVSQSAIDEYAIHQYRDFVGTSASAVLNWKGQSSLAPLTSIVVLQIYNYNQATPSLRWETVASNNSELANTDFTLNKTIADLTDYKKSDGTICCRIYQLNT